MSERPSWENSLDQLTNELGAKLQLGFAISLQAKEYIASISDQETRTALKSLFDRIGASARASSDTKWLLAMANAGLDQETINNIWFNKEELSALVHDSIRDIIDKLQDSQGA